MIEEIAEQIKKTLPDHTVVMMVMKDNEVSNFALNLTINDLSMLYANYLTELFENSDTKNIDHSVLVDEFIVITKDRAKRLLKNG